MTTTIKNLTDKQKCTLLISLKEQYRNNHPMTNSEENTMWDLSDYFWLKAGGKRTLLSNVPSKK